MIGDQVYLSKLGINSPVQLTLYIDAVSFRAHSDNIVQHLVENEEAFEAGSNTIQVLIISAIIYYITVIMIKKQYATVIHCLELTSRRRIPIVRAQDVTVTEISPNVWDISVHPWNCVVMETFTALGVIYIYICIYKFEQLIHIINMIILLMIIIFT